MPILSSEKPCFLLQKTSLSSFKLFLRRWCSVLLSAITVLLPCSSMLSGCFTLQEMVTSHDKEIEILEKQSVIDRPFCEASYDLRSNKISLRSGKRCVLETQSIYERTLTVKRTAPFNHKIFYVVGGIFLAGGVTLLATAHNFSDKPGFNEEIYEETGDPEQAKTGSPRDAAYTFGVLLSLSGIILSSQGVYVSLNSGTEKTKSEYYGPLEVEETPCGMSNPLSHQKVTLNVHDENHLVSTAEMTTDIDGTFTLDPAALNLNKNTVSGKEIEIEFIPDQVSPCSLSILTEILFL